MDVREDSQPCLLDGEDLIPLAAVAEYLADRTGRKPHVSAVHRWASRGCAGRILETVCVGRTRLTSIAAVHRFMRPRPADAPVATVEVRPGRPVVAKVSRASADVSALQARVFKAGRKAVRR